MSSVRRRAGRGKEAWSMAVMRCLITLVLALVQSALGAAALREPVHPRRNVDVFPPVQAKFIRFTIHATNRGEPCLDELEIYAAGAPSRNVALAANGARATASGSLPNYAIHDLEGVNDGRYGNGRSWIADRIEGAWVQIELPEALEIDTVVWGRDREGKFIDRLSTEYEIAVALTTNAWRTVASSTDREPLGVGARLTGVPSLSRPFVNRFAPVSTTLSPESHRASPEYNIDVWQTSDGLPGNTVTAIQQTEEGYLWIGTLNGLARFDGVTFKAFGEASALPNSRVLCLLAAKDGTLWIGTDGGLASWRAGSFRTFTRADGLSSDTVIALAEDGAGRIWVGTALGLNCRQDERFLELPPETSGRGQSIASVVAGMEDSLWIVVENRLLVGSPRGPRRQPEGNDPSAFSSVLTASAGGLGRVWFGGANGYVGAIQDGVVTVFGEQPGQLLGAIWALYETRQGDVWVGTSSSGLRRLRQGRFTSLTTQEGLSDNSVRCLFEDMEGSLWAGTVGGGLNRIKPRKLATVTTRDGLAHNVVMSLAEDSDGTLWVGSNCGGLSARREGAFAPYYASYLLDNECIWSLLPGRDGSLWVGTWGGGLFEMRGRDVRNFSIARLGDDDPVIALCEDGSDGLWVGTMQGGLKHFHDGRVTSDLATNGLPSHPITALVREPNGVLWVGTGGAGVHRFEGGRFTAFARSQGLPSNLVRTLFRDSRGVLWMGTGGGLARIVSGRIDAFTRAQGLLDDVISQILEDDRGYLWFGCNQGIFRVARREFDEVAAGTIARVNAIAYGRAEGMESLECTGGFHPAGLKTRDGKLWFSTVKGLVMVDPETIQVNERPPRVVVEQVVADGTSVLEPEHREALLRFGPGLRRLEFQYTALSLVAPERNRFRYRLEELETEWVEAGGQRVAAYPGLPPGRYHFRVTACNNDGVWNESAATLAFLVRPAFWQTLWFQGLLALSVLGGGGWAVRNASIRRLRRKLRHLQERHALELERTRIAQDIHDELGANLTRIGLLTELGHKHREQPEALGADLNRISATARETVRAMDAIVWAVNPRNDSLDHFANYVSQFAEDLFRLTPIRCRLDVPLDLPEKPLLTESRHQLFLAVKESLNNVVRHSDATEVWLRLRCENGHLRLVIEDNGRGLPSGEPAAGHDGLVNIRSRVERLGGQFKVDSGPGRGTRLTLCLPMTGHVAS